MGMIKLSIDRALTGAMSAIKDNTRATDVIIIAVDRQTGEFKINAFPPEPRRMMQVLERTMHKIKQGVQ